MIGSIEILLEADGPTYPCDTANGGPASRSRRYAQTVRCIDWTEAHGNGRAVKLGTRTWRSAQQTQARNQRTEPTNVLRLTLLLRLHTTAFRFINVVVGDPVSRPRTLTYRR